MHKPILDACCGSRMFHFNKHHPCILFADNCELDTTIKDRGVLRKLEIKPDVKHDFTCMPYPDKTGINGSACADAGYIKFQRFATPFPMAVSDDLLYNVLRLFLR